MEDERYQKELFEFEKPKKPLFRFGRILPKSNVIITLTLERLIFISIGIIMLMVVFYALGVERGKSQFKASLSIPIMPLEKISLPSPTPIVQKRIVNIEPEARPVLQEKPPITPAKKEIIPESEKPYTIVAVTFARRETAQAEVNRLKKEGFDAFVAESDPYFLVCVGAYPDKESTQSKKALNRVRQIYKDAYFKLR